MNWQVELRTRLLNSAGVAAYVGDRVDWHDAPRGAVYPSVILQLISDPRPVTLDGAAHHRETRVQADCRALDAVTVARLREAVIDALGEQWTGGDGRLYAPGFVDSAGGGADRRDDSVTVHRERIDFLFWHD